MKPTLPGCRFREHPPAPPRQAHRPAPGRLADTAKRLKSLKWLAAAPLAAALLPTAGWAAILAVTSTADDGVGSLRRAIAQSAIFPSIDTLVLELPGPNAKIILTSGPLTINSNLAIIGLGADRVSIETSTSADVFRITSGRTVTLSGMTISGGEDGVQVSGNDNVLTIAACRIQNQRIDDGLSIDGHRNTVTVKDTVFSGSEDNLAVEGNNNIVTVDYSTSTLAREDGIEIDGSDNVVTIRNSTVNHNGLGIIPGTAPNDGIDIDGARNVLQIEQATLSSNGEDGLDVEGPGNRVTVRHSTVTRNRRDGLILQDASATSSVVVHGSIAAGNIGPDAVGRFRSGGHNLIGPVDSAATGFVAPGDKTQVANAGLGPLQNNGGRTLTHALLPGSPAIDAGPFYFRPPPDFDQRGPKFPRILGSRIDIGAVEAGK